MTDKHSSFPRNDSGDESLDRLLGALREVEPPPRPDDAEIIKRLNELPPSRSSWITTLIERTNKMPASIRYGVAATLLAAAILFGLLPGSSNPVFGDVDRAIKQKKTVSISVEIDVLTGIEDAVAVLLREGPDLPPRAGRAARTRHPPRPALRSGRRRWRPRRSGARRCPRWT